MSFWGELKRRNVFKVGAVYVIVAWVILQAVSIIFPLLHLPSWTGTFVTVLIIIGFPVALIFAWAFELTAEGVKRTSEVPQQESITHATGRKLNYILGGLLILAVALLIFDNYYLDRRVVETETAITEADQTPGPLKKEEALKTIAVLPFDDLSPEKDQEYFVLGLSEEILNSLAQIADLTVIAKTSSFSFRDTNKTIQEIAGALGVENILEGSVRKAGNALRITTQLIKAVDGSHLWSKTYNRELKDIFSVQEDIATAVANELKITLGIGKSFNQLGGTENAAAYELYVVSKGQMEKAFSFETLTRALESVDAAISLDPDFAFAWMLKAYIHSEFNVYVPSNLATAESDKALSSAQKAIELAPNLTDGYIVLGGIKTQRGNYIEAGIDFRKSIELKTESTSITDLVVAMHYFAVGYIEKGYKLIEEMRRKDPFNEDVREWSLWSYVFLNNIKGTNEEIKRIKAAFGDSLDTAITWARLGADNIVSKDEIVIGYSQITSNIFSAAKENFSSHESAISALRKIYANSNNLSHSNFMDISVWAAYFGDPEFSMESMEKGINIEAAGIFWVWLPVMHEVRQLPRFKEFIREIGLVDYWNQFGWPDICRPLDNGDFVCD